MTTKRQIMERLDNQGGWLGSLDRRLDAYEERIAGVDLRVERDTMKIKELRDALGSCPFKDFASWLRDISARCDALAEHLGVEFDSRSHVCVTPKSKE